MKEKWREMAVLTMQQWKEGKDYRIGAEFLIGYWGGCISSEQDKAEFCIKCAFVRKKAQVGRLENLPEPEVYSSKYKALVLVWQRTHTVGRYYKQQPCIAVYYDNHSKHKNSVTQVHVCLTWQSAVHTVTINLLKPTGYLLYQQFNIQQLYALPTLYLCVLYLSENKQRLVPLTA